MSKRTSIPSPPNRFFESISVDQQFEDKFTKPTECDGESVRSAESNSTIHFHDCGQWLAYVHEFSKNENGILPLKYSRIQRSYEFLKSIGVRVPAHVFGDTWIASKAIPQKYIYPEAQLTCRYDRVEDELLDDLLIKSLLTGNGDVYHDNIVVDDDGIPYLIDFGAFRKVGKRYDTIRNRLIDMFQKIERPEFSIELFEARLLSAISHFPKNHQFVASEGTIKGPSPYFDMHHPSPPSADWNHFQYMLTQIVTEIPTYWNEQNPLSYDIWDIDYSEYPAPVRP